MGIMCNVKKITNGKPVKYAFGLIPIAVVIGVAIRYGATEKQVEVNVKDIAKVNKDIVKVKEDTAKIPVIENNVNHIMTEQRGIRTDIKEILRRVK